MVLPTPLSPSMCIACPAFKQKLTSANKGLLPRLQERFETLSMV
jgi:hypothetical protein